MPAQRKPRDVPQDRDDLVVQLQQRLDAVPAPLEPPDLSALDGFLCGVLLQPRAVPPARWLPFVADVEGREPPAGADLRELHALAGRRHAELERAITRRQWFDPWIAELNPGAAVSEAVLPWVAGFAAAMERFPELAASDDARLLEPLALLYLHFDPDDLEDADALLEFIETIEPPADLAEAAEDLVRAVLLMADVTRPLAPPAVRGARPGGATARRRPRR
jgi:uncharacterized protein